MRMFPLLILTVALLVAGNAAYFSVKGIGLLFAGSFLSVIIMASSLEIGKLVAASFLYRKWKDLKLLMRSYLVGAVGLLMVITSLGIYGFLSDAYQDTKTKVDLYESRIASLQQENVNIQSQINGIEESRDVVDNKTSEALNNYKEIYDKYVARQQESIRLLNDRLEVLDGEMILAQSQKGGLFSSKKKKVEELRVRQAPERASIAEELATINTDMQREYKEFLIKVDSLSQGTEDTVDAQVKAEPLYTKIRNNDEGIMQLNVDISKTDIGSFKFIARVFDIETDTAVKWFMIMIVLVFDPLAVCLIIGFNMYIMRTPYEGYEREKKRVPAWTSIKEAVGKLTRARHPRERQDGK